MLATAISVWVVGVILCLIGCAVKENALCAAGTVVALIGALWVVHILWGAACCARFLRASSAPKQAAAGGKRVRFAVPEVTSRWSDDRPRNGPRPTPGPRSVSGYVTTKPLRPHRIHTGPATGAG